MSDFSRKAALACLAVGLLGACGREAQRPSPSADSVRQQGVLPADVRPAPAMPARFGIGRPAIAAEIRAWDIDVEPDGTGLPSGRGTYGQGAAVFAAKCALCHGVRGEGIGPYPKLIGREPRDGFPFAEDLRYVKTVGNYWPYATTIYDYVHRAMPLNAPGSLKPDEVYSLVAFLLARNEIIDTTAVMDARTLPRVRMPAASHFVRDDRVGGSGPFR